MSDDRENLEATGAAIALRECGQFSPVTGTLDYYDPHRKIVMLCGRTAKGKDWRALISAAHEAAHAKQHERWPWLMSMSWFLPVRVFLEWHACRYAEKVCKLHLSKEDIRLARRLENLSLLRILLGLQN